jgi:hypothetical protein
MADGETGIGRTTVISVDRARDHDGIADDRLTALALAADPDQPVDPDALPISFSTAAPSGLLPEWYMPISTGRERARRVMLGALVLILVVINAAGLCVTYGFPEIAW